MNPEQLSDINELYAEALRLIEEYSAKSARHKQLIGSLVQCAEHSQPYRTSVNDIRGRRPGRGSDKKTTVSLNIDGKNIPNLQTIEGSLQAKIDAYHYNGDPHMNAVVGPDADDEWDVNVTFSIKRDAPQSTTPEEKLADGYPDTLFIEEFRYREPIDTIDYDTWPHSSEKLSQFVETLKGKMQELDDEIQRLLETISLLGITEEATDESEVSALDS